MFQVRIHGRGGQGVVTAAEMLAMAAFFEGKYAQAFPSFGSERMGAPVVSFCRMDDSEIRAREPIANPDALLVQDVTLVHQADIFAGIGPETYVLINTGKTVAQLGIADVTAVLDQSRLLAVPATELALEHVGRAVPNAALLGGFAGISGYVSLGSVERAISNRFSGIVAEGNIRAARAAFAFVNQEVTELSHSGAIHAAGASGGSKDA